MRRNQWRRHRPLFASPVGKDLRRPKMRWRILPIFWLALKRTCFVIGAMVLFSAVMGIFSATLVTKQSAPPLPKEMVLLLHFEDGFSELPQEVSFADPFAIGPPTMRDLVGAIDRAAKDDRVKGIFARMDSGSFDLTHTQEVRAALARFKESGKFAYLYSPSLGDGGGGLGRYYLASIFDERWMQPLGVVSIPGVSAEMPYLRGVLDKIGVTPNFFQRKEYKNAYENLTADHMSEKSRESLEGVVDNMRSVLLKDISADLGISQNKFESLVNKGLFTAPEALKAGLITHMDYVDVLSERIKADVTGDPEYEDELFVEARDYINATRKVKTQDSPSEGLIHHKPKVALIYAVGAIVDTRMGSSSPIPGGGIAAADEIAPAMMDAADDDSIQTIVLRIDSPGGSPLASETILRSIRKAQEKGKTVIVSMGPTAASGGYWIAAYADKIFVLPTTLTGSIGVVGGKFTFGDLSDKIGVNWESVEWGKNSGLWSITSPFSESEAERINAMLDAVYDAFITRVAEGRNMDKKAVDAIARGRVWTGSDALRIGLADEEGGLNEALNFAAQTLGKTDQNDIDVIIMPKPKTALEQFIELLGGGSTVFEGLKFNASLAKFLGPVLEQTQALSGPSGVSAYEPVRVE